MEAYILSVDQSTQGTKALLFDADGRMLQRTDIAHKQIINNKGWVEHNPQEIMDNTISAIKNLLAKTGIDKNKIRAMGISNQRETVMAWDKSTGKPVYNAIVWQCKRGAAICSAINDMGYAGSIREKTGLQLSPYFSAAKLAWILQNVAGTAQLMQEGNLCCGTMDSWLIYCLTNGASFKTDYSNASRTQLFNIHTLQWDTEICRLFHIECSALPEVIDSNGYFGETDLGGLLDKPIPIRSVMGDSHGALYGQGCLEKGMVKATYGTGSSIMMNIGPAPVHSNALVTSLGWVLDGKATYVLEGNVNYAGAVITWLIDDLKLINSPQESEELAKIAHANDTAYLVPAFTGLGAPYWNSNATATIVGMTRTTGKAEFVKAAVESIAYQITDVLMAMSDESGQPIVELRADGGAVKNAYLMQFQSDIAAIPVRVADAEEFSGIGVAYAAGLTTGLYTKDVLLSLKGGNFYQPTIHKDSRQLKYEGWKNAVGSLL